MRGTRTKEKVCIQNLNRSFELYTVALAIPDTSIAYHPSHKLYLHFAKKERIIDYFRELTTINNCDRRYSILYQTSCIEYAFTVFFHGLSIAFKNVGSKNRWNNGFPLLFSIESFDMDMNARNVRLMKTFARENGCHINDF